MIMIGICLPRLAKKVALSPLFFVRGGYVLPGYQLFYNAGQYGDYWSSRAYSNTDVAYSLDFHNSSVTPSGNGNRYLGLSLRCLIPTS